MNKESNFYKYYFNIIWLVLGLVMSFLLTIILVYGSSIISDNIDRVKSGLSIKDTLDIKFLFTLVVFGMIFAFLRSFFLSKFSLEVTYFIKYDLADKILKMKIKYFDTNSSGSIINKTATDVGEIEKLLSEVFPKMLESLITVVIIGFSIFKLNIDLGIIVFICCFFIVFLSRIASKKLASLTHGRKNLHDDLLSISGDYIGGIVTGKTYNLFKMMDRNINKCIDKILENEFVRIKISSYSWILEAFVNWLPGIISITFITLSYTKSEISMGDTTYLILMVNRLFKPFSEFPLLLNEISEHYVSVTRIKTLLHAEEENVNENKDNLLLNSDESDIAIKMTNVNFSYVDDHNILKNINIEIKKGEDVAFVGRSGSGKSTIFKLLCGFYKQNSGNIELFGDDYSDLSLYEIRKNISLVSQDTFLFHGSIFENISYGKIGATLDEVIDACKNANIHDSIMNMTDGYDTIVNGDSGLSGGERQRLSLARAFLKNAPILLLDEPTSSLDTKSEFLIQDALSKLKGDKTILTIAHRLSTVKNADRIIVLSNGEIVENGNNDSLMEKKGIYYKLNSNEDEVN